MSSFGVVVLIEALTICTFSSAHLSYNPANANGALSDREKWHARFFFPTNLHAQTGADLVHAVGHHFANIRALSGVHR